MIKNAFSHKIPVFVIFMGLLLQPYVERRCIFFMKYSQTQAIDRFRPGKEPRLLICNQGFSKKCIKCKTLSGLTKLVPKRFILN